ncbi:mannose-6-phosphate isomerase, class I [Kocuria sp.]|uniref:mannose-6-phosphate isomerase, class I n=1 Tax=Kocuria sp. TaxID=1871328 RepID=UPI0026DF9765|nr:mannose-6-phosphate isomerase, class I [Kocuria sp.]MDO5618677.1 mannose-6-phosphate isomerase, class I [Kocuria sp.]
MAEFFATTDPIQDYAWGSRSVLARMQSREVPAATPEAELWVGSHPSGPSQLSVDGREISLIDLLAEDPQRLLGSLTAALDHDGDLPFLLKILAIDAPLSIQVHPSPEQAEEGWQREEAAGVALTASSRNYKDRRPKPEIGVAITRVETLSGVRGNGELAVLAEALDQQWLRDVLATGEPVLPAVLQLPAEQAESALVDLLHAVEKLPTHDEVGALLRYIAGRHPGDRGLLVALCMNHVVLEPGEAIFTPAGQLHAYLRGTAVELMACSDNVLRAGLTPKHIDVAELLAIVNPDQEDTDPIDVTVAPDGLRHYPLWDDRLSLVSATVGDGSTANFPPTTCVVLCTDGELSLTVQDGAQYQLGAGHSVWCRTDGSPIAVGGTGTAYAVGLNA